MIVLSLAWRNTLRSFPRRWPVFVILAAAVGVLEVGNTLFEYAMGGLERTYVHSFTSELTISARSTEGFTIFGNELPLIGEYQVLPVLPDAANWMERVKASGGAAIGQVTAGGVLSSAGWSRAIPVFGVDFSEYFHFFPDLVLVKGSLPAPDSQALVMNEVQYDEASRTLGSPPAMGTPFTLTVFNDNSFTIRQVTLAAVYRYPVRDEVLDRIALVDPDTARALNGYIYGAVTTTRAASLGTSATEVDSLFESSNDIVESSGKGLSEQVVADRLKDSTARRELNATVDGSWNFVLIKPGVAGARELRTILKSDPEVQIRDWRDTVGGNAMIVWLLQVVFNLGLVFITAAAALVGVNGLALSVAERTQELGTLRALGATKLRVAGLVTAESILLVTGAGIVGAALGAGAVVWLGSRGLLLTNPYLQSLFGSSELRPTISVEQMVMSGVFSLGLGLVAIIIPVRRVLKITPVAAMARH